MSESKENIDSAILSLTAGFIADVLSRYAPRVMLRNNSTAYFGCEYAAVPRHPKPSEALMLGGEIFKLVGAKLTHRVRRLRSGLPDIVLTFAPEGVTEFRHLYLPAEKLEGAIDISFFVDAKRAKPMSLSELIALFLSVRMPDRKDGLTYRQVLDRLILVERKKHSAVLMRTHENFGDW